ncbi:MAG: DUF2784 family protein [Bacteroidales bacterium]|nr:DUF2784 family protein [Bacteroidales bacterium]
MNLIMLQLLNIILNITHILLMLFIMTGWIFRRSRMIHLLVVLLTGFSWIVFINSKEIGYCILTDWQWQVLGRMGRTNLPETYIQYLYELLSGDSMLKATSRNITRSVWIFSLSVSMALFIKKYFYIQIQKIVNNH